MTLFRRLVRYERRGFDLTAVVVSGALLWAAPFAVSFAVEPLRDDHRGCFESVMAVTVAAACTAVIVRYLIGHPETSSARCAAIGLVWAAMSIVFDLPLMLTEPVNMSLGEYMADIGLTYAMYPLIALGAGVLAARAR